MTNQPPNQVFFSHSQENREFVASLARRLQADARLSFWFAPWHSVPGEPIQEQMEDALWDAQSCAVFISGQLQGWQNEQMRVAIQTRVEDEPGYRVIPVLVPGASRPSRRDLPRFLRRYEMVEFQGLDDESAFKRLLAGILGLPPIQVDGYVQTEAAKERLPPPPSGVFERGHALVIGVANYPQVSPLPTTVLDDARDLRALLTDPAACGYPPDQVTQLLDDEATADGIRAALADLAARAGPDDTTVIFFSGHGAHDASEKESDQTAEEMPEHRTPARIDRAKLRHLLDTRFDEGELRTLCFDLGFDYDNLPGRTKADKARELVAFSERRGHIPELLKRGAQLRPDVPWDDVLKATQGATTPRPDTKAERLSRAYLLPYDCDPANLSATAIRGDEMTALLREIKAGRLLVLFDSCHSGGAGDPKSLLPQFKTGLSEDYYQALAQGKGRVVIASSRPDEVSWALSGMNNSLFTHYLLQALRGQARTLSDGYVRVFDVFRHVADHVPTKANQHPIFKATAMEQDFPIALVKRQP